MEVGRSCAGIPGIAHKTDCVSDLHLLAVPHVLLIQVGVVDVGIPYVVADPDDPSAEIGHSHPIRHACGGGKNRSSSACEDVYSFVCPSASVSVYTPETLNGSHVVPLDGEGQLSAQPQGDVVATAPQEFRLNA